MGSGKKHKRDRDPSVTAPSSSRSSQVGSSSSSSVTAASSSSRSKHTSRDSKLRAPSPPVFRLDERSSVRDRERDRRHRSDAFASKSDRPSDRRRDRSREPRDRSRDRDARDRSREPRDRSRDRHPAHASQGRRDRIEVYDSDDSDVVEVPIAPPAPKISDDAVPEAPPAPTTSSSRSRRRSPSPIPDNGAGDVLSVAETNKLRLKLGLKPLDVDEPSASSSASGAGSAAAMLRDPANAGLQAHKDEWGEFLHRPADNAAAKLESEKLREKLRQRKERRMHEERLQRIGKLGEDRDADDLNGWLARSRDKERARAEAEKRARQQAELDAELDADESTAAERRAAKDAVYGERNLTGLKVDHDVERFGEGKTVILTLKDQDVLDEQHGDTLVNVNMLDDERYAKSNANKKAKPRSYGYDVYEEQFDELGLPIDRNVLSKYDDELDDAADRRQTFAIGESADAELQRRRRAHDIKTKLAGKRLETLNEPLTRLASDTYTEQEMSEKFRKTKRKVKKLRTKLKADDLLPLPGDSASADLGRRQRPKNESDDEAKPDDEKKPWPGKAEPHDDDEDDDLAAILAKARRLKQKDALIVKMLDPKTEIKAEPDAADDGRTADAFDTNIVLNATAEFCRTLGDIPTYGMSGNRDGDAGDMMRDGHSDDDDMETDAQAALRAAAASAAALAERSTGTWNSVNPDVIDVTGDDDAPVERSTRNEAAILDEEPDVGSGMGAALKLALSKGYLEKEDQNRPSNTRMAHLQAKNYSIEDKAYGDDDKFNRRDRFQHGPVSEFREKDSYRPNVKLEYIDDSGRQLNEKEAFRYLSHKFHGKGPGKNKIEKRLKKNEQDGLLMKMSSTDTPLGTLTMLKHKQQETHSPYIVLSGSKQLQNAGSSSIVKHK